MLLQTWQRWKNDTLAKLFQGFRQQVIWPTLLWGNNLRIHKKNIWLTTTTSWKPATFLHRSLCKPGENLLYILKFVNEADRDLDPSRWEKKDSHKISSRVLSILQGSYLTTLSRAVLLWFYLSSSSVIQTSCLNKSLEMKWFYGLEQEKFIEYDFCPHRE